MSKSPLKKYFEKSAFKAEEESRGPIRELRDKIKADYYNVDPDSYYKGEDVRKFSTPENESMIDMANRVKGEVKHKKNVIDQRVEKYNRFLNPGDKNYIDDEIKMSMYKNPHYKVDNR
tara:strand:+ start:733 stop:1086 length:354 start_codon:yes stop_codon:yes gene_type:complete